MQKRTVAIAAAACVLLAHLISLRHETTVAHVRDAAGVMEHAHALAEYHAISTTQHLHGSEADGHRDSGTCALLVGLDQSTVISPAPSLVTGIAAHEVAVEIAPPTIVVGVSVLAFAPKTSPPSFA